MPIDFKQVFYTYSPKSPLSYGALKNITLTIKDHSFTAIIGQTGSGKSTLIQHINGLLVPSQGEIDINGYLLTSNKKSLRKIKELRKNVGLVFQFPEYQLFEDTVLKDVCFGPKNFEIPEKEYLENAKDALRLVGIDESLWGRSPFELSGGQRRRVAIAGIITLHPNVLILDEPTAGLDPKGTHDMMDLFYKIYQSGTTIIMVSHDMNNVLEYATDVVVMRNGEVCKTGTPIALFKDDRAVQEVGIEEPMVIKFAKKLITRGINIDLDKVRDAKSLAEQIVRGKYHE